MQNPIIGIDLGTTNSEVAVYENGNVIVIEENGMQMLPSCVGISSENAIMVGAPARNQAILYPENTVKSVKRHMGQEQTFNLGGVSYTPQEISAVILKRLKQIAENHIQHPITQAVITVPAYFSDSQRQATREAGEIAGLEVVRIINEPTAAALAYGAQQHQQQQRIVVYDLGGGTFDVSVVQIENGVVEVLSSHGNSHLGGDDFDQLLVDYICQHLQQKHALDVSHDLTVMARINRAAEAAKLCLSQQPFAHIQEEYLTTHEDVAIHLDLEVSRDTYESLIATLIDETINAVRIALKDARLPVTEIDEILLVGGSTRIPCIREQLFELFGREAHGEIDADLCVAIGAATQAALIAGEQPGTVLLDITPYTFGTSAVAMLNGEQYPYVYVPVIRKNSKIPVSRAEALQTLHNNQDSIVVTVYQGEQQDALENISIGKFTVTGLQKVPAGNIIIITLTLDLDGVLKVSAKEKATSLEKTVMIENAMGSLNEDTLETAKQRVSQLLGQDDPEMFQQLFAQTGLASDVISGTGQLFDQAREMLPNTNVTDREEMNRLMQQIRQCKEEELALELIAQLQDMVEYLQN